MFAGKRLTGMRGFSLMWLGQLLSLTGTMMTGFALTIWAWLETGSATALALVGFFSFAPTIIFSPVAGALVDRWNRKTVLIAADLASGMGTLTILILYSTGSLEIWHFYIVGVISGIFQALQWPAFSATISTIVPKENYARAQGMVSVAEAGSMIVAPILAAALIGSIGISGIMCIDLMTMSFAVVALLPVFIPRVKANSKTANGKPNLWSEIKYGFTYIRERKGLLYLLMFFLTFNLLSGMAGPLYGPYILSRTGNSQVALGSIMSALGVGGVAGGILLAVWGGPKRKIHGVLLGGALSGAIGACFALAGNVYAWAVVGFLVMFVGPFCGGSSQAIWQSKVAPEVQGRVFATRRMIAQVSAPIAMLMVGPLADDIFEPGMASGGSMSSTFGWLVGTGPGAGMGLIIFLTSMLTVAVAFSAYAVKAIRNVERDLPDHDAAAQAAHPACASSVEGTTDASAPAKAPAPEAEPTGA
jgi:DHA3 family macrolide efflux protein-like MFS transporter